ncbi:hypothetical protein ACFV2Q_10635 [Streptomyces sp. NPDC059650]|uniref:hypothetical protein n=1 Tax=Streptomyces sp. NPDC059650 TaxID=3346896 RepID=UPI00369BC4D4
MPKRAVRTALRTPSAFDDEVGEGACRVGQPPSVRDRGAAEPVERVEEGVEQVRAGDERLGAARSGFDPVEREGTLAAAGLDDLDAFAGDVLAGVRPGPSGEES